MLIFWALLLLVMTQEVVCIPKEEYRQLKRQAKVDIEFLKELAESIADIKSGKVRQVR